MKKSSVSYFQILCYVLERWARNNNQILFGKFKSLPQYRTSDTIDDETMELE